MAEYKVTETELTNVADAIRTKGGTSASLSFPSGFVNAIGNIPTSGGSTLITKSVTSNGTYNASSDNADGYSSVTVAVPSKLITGTFTGTEEGTTITVNVPYTGTGYPIMISVYPSAGAYKSGTTFYTTIQQYAVACFTAIKADMSSTPNYTTQNTDENCYNAVNVYKKSATDATQYTDSMSMTAKTTGNNAASSGTLTCVRFTSNTNLTVYIANSNTGFMKDIEYTYQIIYSS